MRKLYDVLFVSDTHFDSHDEGLVGSDGKIFSLIRKKRYGKIVHVGDLCNFDSFSRFKKNPKRKENVVRSITLGTEFFRNIRKAAPKAEMWWKAGNHDDRLENYCIDNCPELLDLECLSLPSLFKCRESKVNFVSSFDPLILDGLKITHGISVLGQSGYSAHSEMRASAGYSGVSGHTHKLCWVHSHNAEWMELGYLGSLDRRKFAYVGDREPNWKQGFGEGSYIEGDDGNRFWLLRPIEVTNGHFMVDGVLY